MATLKKLPVVALVGRSNVGKSTLFNALTESRRALVSKIAGTTREQNFAEIRWRKSAFFLIDTPGLDALHAKELEADVAEQARRAMEIADVIVFVVDGKKGRHPQDDVLARTLRKIRKPIILGINKMDSLQTRKKLDTDFLQFGYDIAAFSARNGSGTGDLLDRIVELLPKKKPAELPPAFAKVTIMGQPNVGKSSLFNAVIGEDRVLVSPLPNTTRDLHDTDIVYKGKTLTLVDTIGLKRRIGLASAYTKTDRKDMQKMEKEMVSRTERAIERCDVVWYLLDATERVTKHDKSILELATGANRGVIIVINKWDLVPEKDPSTITKYQTYFRKQFPYVSWAKLVFVSAKEKIRVHQLLEATVEVRNNQQRKIPAEELTTFIQQVDHKHQPLRKGVVAAGQHKKPLPVRGFYQTETDPPTFVLHTGRPMDTPPAFIHIVEKELRAKFDLSGTPIRLIVE